jgi:hypothetical protein
MGGGMSVKMSGAEFKKFYEDDEFWPDGVWHEDAQISVDGEDRPDGVESNEVSDTSVVVIEGGALFGEQWEYEGPSLETYFRRWRKKQTTTFLTVECDHTKLEAVKAAIKAAGGKISK